VGVPVQVEAKIVGVLTKDKLIASDAFLQSETFKAFYETNPGKLLSKLSVRLSETLHKKGFSSERPEVLFFFRT